MDPEAKSKGWKQKALGLIALGFGLLLLAGLGFYSYFLATMTPLHPNAADVTSIAHAVPKQQWSKAAEQARQLVRASLSEQNLPGLSVAVGIAGEIVWAEGFGWADVERRVPVAPDNLFRIGSAATALTSAGVGLLLEKDRLNLDDEIQSYVPAFPKKQWPVTLRQLMGHVAGVRHYRGEEFMRSAQCAKSLEGLQFFADDPLRFEPGTRYSFSTYGWVLVSAAVEAAADEPFFTFMRRHVFEPLGMSSTLPDTEDPTSDRATFYFPRAAENTRYGPELASPINYSCLAGAGGFLSTPSDLVRFGMALGSGKLLQPDTVKLLQTPLRLASGDESTYGLGWGLANAPLANEQVPVAGHGRALLPEAQVMGGSTSLLMFPDHAIVVSVTSNISHADTSTIALKVAELFGPQLKSRPPTKATEETQ